MSAPGVMSFALLLLLLLLAVSHGDDVRVLAPRVYHGERVVDHDDYIAISMVSVWYTTSGPTSLQIFACAGVLIHERWVMTAAGCFVSDDLTKYTLIAGRRNLNEQNDLESNYTVTEIIKDATEDIALVKLGRDLDKNGRAFKLWCLDLDGKLSTVNSECVIFGWGRSDGQLGDLTKGNVRVEPLTHCEHEVEGSSLNDHHLCTSGIKGARTCLDDQGGPVICFDQYYRSKISAVMRVRAQYDETPRCFQTVYHTTVSTMKNAILNQPDLHILAHYPAQMGC